MMTSLQQLISGSSPAWLFAKIAHNARLIQEGTIEFSCLYMYLNHGFDINKIIFIPLRSAVQNL